MSTLEQRLTELSHEELVKVALGAMQARQSALSCKIGQKGGVSVYGFGRWPVTLYADQWERLEAFMPQVRQFISENRAKLSTKHDD